MYKLFKENGFETGVWIGGFGHGGTLSHDGKIEKKRDYQKLTGVMGESFEHGYCPSDESFTADYLETVTRIAKLDPDLIMLDDDFRLNCRHYFLGCFCPYHLNEFYKAVGEEVPREKIEDLIYTGGKNKYRDAYMDLSKKLSRILQKKSEKRLRRSIPV